MSHLNSVGSISETEVVNTPLRERLVAKKAQLEMKIELLNLDLARPNAAKHGYLEGEIERKIDRLDDDLIKLQKQLVELVYEEQYGS